MRGTKKEIITEIHHLKISAHNPGSARPSRIHLLVCGAEGEAQTGAREERKRERVFVYREAGRLSRSGIQKFKPGLENLENRLLMLNQVPNGSFEIAACSIECLKRFFPRKAQVCDFGD